MSSKAAQAALVPGRVVLLQLPSGVTELGVILGGPNMDMAKAGGGEDALFAPKRPALTPLGAAAGQAPGASGSGAARRLWVVTLHHPGPQDPAAGDAGAANVSVTTAQQGELHCT